MSMGKFMAACVFVGVAGAAAPAQDGGRLPVLDTFTGTAANDKKPDLKTGFVATGAEWKVTWAKVNPRRELPKVDFTRYFLLVEERDAADPNRCIVAPSKDANGVLSGTMTCTCIAFQPSDRTAYRFHKVSREGVTGVPRFDPAKQKVVVEPLPK